LHSPQGRGVPTAMQFREFAAAETSGLVRRLLAIRTDQTKRELQAVRRAVETALQTVEEKLATASSSNDNVSAVVEKLATAAAAEIESASKRARTDAQAAVDVALAERAEIAAELEEERQQRTTLATELDAERKQRLALAQQLKEANATQAFAEASRSEAEQAREKAEKELGAVRQAAKTAQQDLKTAQQDAKTSQQDLKNAQQDLKNAQQDLKIAQQDLKNVHQDLKTVQQDLKIAQQDVKAAQQETKAAEARTREIEQASAKAEAARAQEGHALSDRMLKDALQPLAHLRSAFERLTHASTIDDVLVGMVDGLATEFARVALFDVNSSRLQGRHHTGFDSTADISKVMIPLTVQSPLTRAVRERRVHGLTGREVTEAATAPFGGAPTFILVLPIAVRGSVLAVLYADNSGQTAAELMTPERRVKFAEILLWHAIPLLTRLSIEYEDLAEVREYAAALVKDLESVYAADAPAHKPAELRHRLQQNLAYARQRFAERAESEGTAAARLFDECLSGVIGVKDATPFARDLAALVGAGGPAVKGRAKAAEAS
jgi:chemotaxis protein histidine kinase CheA